MIINNTEELQLFVPATTSIDDTVLTPQLRNTERVLLKYIDKTLYDELLDRLNNISNTQTSDEWAELNIHLGSFVANYSLLKLAPKLYSSISDAGIRVEHTENTDRSPKWAYEQLKKSYFEDAYNALESALVCIDKNSNAGGLFESFISADKKTEYNTLFIRNAEEFSKYIQTSINQYTYLKVKSTIPVALKLWVNGMITTPILDTILTARNNNSLSKLQKELFDYICHIVANGSLLKSLIFLTINIDSEGLRSLDIANDESLLGNVATDTQLQQLRIQLDENLNHYQVLLKNCLMTNASDIPGFTDSDFYKSAINQPVNRFSHNDGKKTFMV